jgi:hypothetical protein
MSAHGKSSGIPILTPLLGWLDGEDLDYGVIAAIIGVVIILAVLAVVGIPQSKIVTFAFLLSPLWLPYVTFHLFFEKWMEMVGTKFRLTSGRTIYEIKLPPEVFKSPEAMEFVFTQVFNAASPDNLWETYIDGKRPLFYSAELVSKGGDVRFYFTLPDKFIYGFTDNMYAQYPGIELVKLDVDYAAEIPLDLQNFDGLSFMSFIFNKKKDEEFPIKTYLDFGMDKLPKEEEKVDPMTPLLEVLAGIQPHQQLWVQILFKAHRDQNFKNGQLHKVGTWEDRIYDKVDELMKRGAYVEKKADETGARIDLGASRLTTFEKDKVDAMQRNATKVAFHTVIRVAYISHKSFNYDGGLYSRMIRALSQTEMKGRNGIGMKWRTDFNYNWFSDPFGKRKQAMKKHEIALYRERNDHGNTWLFSAEELATIFHIPGRVALTPTLNRVPSTRGDAPSNLPTGNLPI